MIHLMLVLCLPVVLGYSIFLGISGRVNPLRKPYYEDERPSWLFAIWSGISVALIMGLGLRIAYRLPPAEPTDTIVLPVAGLLVTLLLPGYCVYLFYRRHLLNRSVARNGLIIDNFTEVANNANYRADDMDMQFEIEHNPTVNLPKTEDCTMASLRAATVAIKARCVSEARQFSQMELSTMQTQLDKERDLREETEKHLRITRKALARLENERLSQQSSTADALIELEERLSQSIAMQSRFETMASKELAKRTDLEQLVVDLKNRLVKAKHDVRRSIAARAKALSTANKTIAFARQSLRTRARLETEVNELHEKLASIQTLTSSLIRALEKEKRRTEAEISQKAKELVLTEKHLQARKNLEEVSRSIESKLASRFVKKIAKAKPIT